MLPWKVRLVRAAVRRSTRWFTSRIPVVVAVSACGSNAQCPASSPGALKVGTVLDGAAAPAFALRNQVGAAVNLQQMRGHVVVLTILDATCTAECPVTAQYLDWTGQFLGKDVQNVGWMAMSVNPSNTKEDAETFLNKNSVQAPLHILMGGEEKLAPLWKAYHIVVQPDEDGDVQHSLGLYVIEAQGREREWDTVDATITS